MSSTQKRKQYTDVIINFIKKELLESDFKEHIQLQLLYIIVPIILIIALLNFITTMVAVILISYIYGK